MSQVQIVKCLTDCQCVSAVGQIKPLPQADRIDALFEEVRAEQYAVPLLQSRSQSKINISPLSPA